MSADGFPLTPAERTVIEHAQRSLVALLKVAPDLGIRYPAALQRDQLRRQIRAVCDWCTLALGPNTTVPAPVALFAPALSPHVGQGSLTGTADTPTAAVSVSTSPDLPEGGAL